MPITQPQVYGKHEAFKALDIVHNRWFEDRLGACVWHAPSHTILAFVNVITDAEAERVAKWFADLKLVVRGWASGRRRPMQPLEQFLHT